MIIMKILFLIAVFGHLLCGYCDCLLTYVPGGRFDFNQMTDNEKMKAAFSKMPIKNPLLSMLLGCLALLMSCGGYFAIYLWMKQFSNIYAVIILIASAVFFIPGTAHHVFCRCSSCFALSGSVEPATGAVP